MINVGFPRRFLSNLAEIVEPWLIHPFLSGVTKPLGDFVAIGQQDRAFDEGWFKNLGTKHGLLEVNKITADEPLRVQNVNGAATVTLNYDEGDFKLKDGMLNSVDLDLRTPQKSALGVNDFGTGSQLTDWLLSNGSDVLQDELNVQKIRYISLQCGDDFVQDSKLKIKSRGETRVVFYGTDGLSADDDFCYSSGNLSADSFTVTSVKFSGLGDTNLVSIGYLFQSFTAAESGAIDVQARQGSESHRKLSIRVDGSTVKVNAQNQLESAIIYTNPLKISAQEGSGKQVTIQLDPDTFRVGETGQLESKTVYKSPLTLVKAESRVELTLDDVTVKVNDQGQLSSGIIFDAPMSLSEGKVVLKIDDKSMEVTEGGTLKSQPPLVDNQTVAWTSDNKLKTLTRAGKGIHITDYSEINASFVDTEYPLKLDQQTGHLKIYYDDSLITDASGNLSVKPVLVDNFTIIKRSSSNSSVGLDDGALKGNYQGSNGVNISGNKVTGAYQAGNRITISGQTIACDIQDVEDKLDDAVDDIASNAAQAASELAGLASGIAATGAIATGAATASALANTSADLANAGLATLGASVSALDAAAAASQLQSASQFLTLEGEVAGIQSEIAASDVALQSQLGVLEGIVSAHTISLSTLTAASTANTASVTSALGSIVALQSQVGILETGAVSTGVTLAAHTGNLSTIDGTLVSLTAGLSAASTLASAAQATGTSALGLATSANGLGLSNSAEIALLWGALGLSVVGGAVVGGTSSSSLQNQISSLDSRVDDQETSTSNLWGQVNDIWAQTVQTSSMAGLLLPYQKSITPVGPFLSMDASANLSFNQGSITQTGVLQALTVSGGVNFNSTTVAASGLGALLLAGGLNARNAYLGTNLSSSTPIVTLFGGNTGTGASGSPALCFEYYGTGFKHFIRTRHQNVANSSNNAIDFFVSSSSSSTASTQPGTGNVNTFSVHGQGFTSTAGTVTGALSVGSLTIGGAVAATQTYVTALGYLTSSAAASVYLTQANASSVFLTQSNAASTYAALWSTPSFNGLNVSNTSIGWNIDNGSGASFISTNKQTGGGGLVLRNGDGTNWTTQLVVDYKNDLFVTGDIYSRNYQLASQYWVGQQGFVTTSALNTSLAGYQAKLNAPSSGLTLVGNTLSLDTGVVALKSDLNPFITSAALGPYATIASVSNNLSSAGYGLTRNGNQVSMLPDQILSSLKITSGVPPTTQGCSILWNTQEPGWARTEIFNHRGAGYGDFKFWQTSNDGGIYELFRIASDGCYILGQAAKVADQNWSYSKSQADSIFATQTSLGSYVTTSAANSLYAPIFTVSAPLSKSGNNIAIDLSSYQGKITASSPLTLTAAGALSLTTTSITSVGSLSSLSLSGSISEVANVNGGLAITVRNTSTGTNAYSILSLLNSSNTGVNLFMNSTTRTADGGVNTATLRSDIGQLILSAAYGSLTNSIRVTNSSVELSNPLNINGAPVLTTNTASVLLNDQLEVGHAYTDADASRNNQIQIRAQPYNSTTKIGASLMMYMQNPYGPVVNLHGMSFTEQHLVLGGTLWANDVYASSANVGLFSRMGSVLNVLISDPSFWTSGAGTNQKVTTAFRAPISIDMNSGLVQLGVPNGNVSIVNHEFSDHFIRIGKKSANFWASLEFFSNDTTTRTGVIEHEPNNTSFASPNGNLCYRNEVQASYVQINNRADGYPTSYQVKNGHFFNGCTQIDGALCINGYSQYASSSQPSTYYWKNGADYGILNANQSYQVGLFCMAPIVAAALYTISDQRQKKHIEPIPTDSALEIVERLDSKSFTWRESGQPSLGWISQEVEEFVPSAVKDVSGTLHLATDQLSAILWAAVKELNAKLKTLKKSSCDCGK